LKVDFKNSFLKDIKRVKDKSVKQRLKEIIDAAEKAEQLQKISDIKKLKGSDSFYRIRIGDYRIGLLVTEDTVIFVRFLHRREIYRYFP